jgi:hypothetical protein
MEIDIKKICVGDRVEIELFDGWFRGTVLEIKPHLPGTIRTIIHLDEHPNLEKAVSKAVSRAVASIVGPRRVVWGMGENYWDTRLVGTLELLAEL